ncbi:MAG: hypothetical protein EOO73_34585 [Myxococcales bacterium]|nr:MAG: hypothetical protein EOO73_34585 [Myxococcales bacterium]
MGRSLGWVFVWLCWSVACGGRFQRGDEDGGLGGTSTGQAGSGAQGGTSSLGAASSGGGSGPIGGGAAQTAGTSSVGGVASGGFGGACACDPIACAPGYISVPTPSGCCFQCELDHASCDRQRDDYAGYRKAVLFKYAPYKCAASTDCAIYYDKNECQVYSCGALIDSASRPSIDAELNAFARATCNPACPAPPIPPCEPPSTPTCFKGSCE